MTALLAATVAPAQRCRSARSAATVGHAAAALGLVGATPLLLGELALTRFDALPVALTAATRRRAPPRPAATRRRRARARRRGEALPAPPRAARRALRAPPRAAGARRLVVDRDHRRDGARLVVLPFVALAPGEAWFSIRAQLTRGVQVESLPGASRLALGVAADKVGLGGARHRRRRGRDRRRAQRRRDRRARPGRRGARRPGRARDRRRGLGRRLAAAGRTRHGSCGTARRSSPPSSRSGGCSPRSSCSGSSRSCRSSRAGADALATALLAAALVADARLVPGPLPRLRQRAGRARDRLPARAERAAARAARRARSADRTARSGRRAGRRRRRGRTRARRERRRRAPPRPSSRSPAASRGPPSDGRERSPTSAAAAARPRRRRRRGATARAADRASTSGPSAARATGSTSGRGTRRRAPPTRRSFAIHRSRFAGSSNTTWCSVGDVQTSRIELSGVESWALWYSDGIGSPSVGLGQLRPSTTTVGPGAGAAGAPVAGLAATGAVRPAKSGFAELLPEVAEHAAGECPRVLPHRLARARPRIP